MERDILQSKKTESSEELNAPNLACMRHSLPSWHDMRKDRFSRYFIGNPLWLGLKKCAIVKYNVVSKQVIQKLCFRWMQLFWERLSQKGVQVHSTRPKGYCGKWYNLSRNSCKQAFVLWCSYSQVEKKLRQKKSVLCGQSVDWRWSCPALSENIIVQKAKTKAQGRFVLKKTDHHIHLHKKRFFLEGNYKKRSQRDDSLWILIPVSQIKPGLNLK